MASLREWMEERRTEGIGATASLCLVAASMAGIGLVLWRGSVAPVPSPGKRAGVIAPELRQDASQVRYATLEGLPLDAAGLQGKVVLIHLWSLRSAPCRIGLPELAALQASPAFAGKAEIVPIALAPGSAAEVRGFLASHPNLRFRAYVPSPEAPALGPLGAIAAVPTTFVLDRQGRVRQRWTGYVPGLAAAALKGALEEP